MTPSYSDSVAVNSTGRSGTPLPRAEARQGDLLPRGERPHHGVQDGCHRLLGYLAVTEIGGLNAPRSHWWLSRLGFALDEVRHAGDGDGNDAVLGKRR